MNSLPIGALPTEDDVEGIQYALDTIRRVRKEPTSIAVIGAIIAIVGGGVGLYLNNKNGILRWPEKSPLVTEAQPTNGSPGQQDNDQNPLSQGE